MNGMVLEVKADGDAPTSLLRDEPCSASECSSQERRGDAMQDAMGDHRRLCDRIERDEVDEQRNHLSKDR
jgi:hypothetical protein